MTKHQDITTQHSPKKFKTILADPPWDVAQKGKLGASQHYKLMTIDQIKKMPVADLAESNAHLWIWTYPDALEQSFDVVRAWALSQSLSSLGLSLASVWVIISEMLPSRLSSPHEVKSPLSLKGKSTGACSPSKTILTSLKNFIASSNAVQMATTLNSSPAVLYRRTKIGVFGVMKSKAILLFRIIQYQIIRKTHEIFERQDKMNEKANRLHCRLLPFGDIGKLRRQTPYRYLAGISNYSDPCFGILYRHHCHQTS